MPTYLPSPIWTYLAAAGIWRQCLYDDGHSVDDDGDDDGDDGVLYRAVVDDDYDDDVGSDVTMTAVMTIVSIR